jgi:Type II restriction endonuclease EcoO109I
MNMKRPIVRSKLLREMPEAEFAAVTQTTLELLERRLDKVRKMTSVDSTDVNLNPFLMLAMAPAYNIYSPLEAAEYAQMSKLPHGDATAFGRFVEDKVFPIFGADDPSEKSRKPALFSPIDKEITVDGERFLMSLKSGPWTMNQSHANEMVANFPAIHEETGCRLIIGVFYGSEARLNNKPALVKAKTGEYVHTLVGKQLWEFVTGVRDAHLAIYSAIQAAQTEFARLHGGKTFAEHIMEARLALADSFRTAFGVVESGDAMWRRIFEGSF